MDPGAVVGAAGGEWWDNNRDKNYRVGFRVREGGGENRVGMRKPAMSAPCESMLFSPFELIWILPRSVVSPYFTITIRNATFTHPIPPVLITHSPHPTPQLCTERGTRTSDLVQAEETQFD